MPDTTQLTQEARLATTHDDRVADLADGAVPGATTDTSASYGPGGDLRPVPQPHSHGGTPAPGDSRGSRRTSFDVEDFVVPSGREEEWRFTPVDRLEALFEPAPTQEGAATVKVVAPAGVEHGDVGRENLVRGSVLVPGDRAAAVAASGADQALLVRIPVETELTDQVTVTVSGHGGRVNSHLIVDAGRHSKAVVVLDHTGSAAFAGNVEIRVGEGANLTVVSLQDWDDDALHLGQHDALVGRDATFRHIAVTLGGSVVRLNTNVRFDGPGADATLLGLYFADAGQHQENRLFVDHSAPQCRSRVTYKGALQGEDAHTVWIGDVLIRAAAQGTDTYELNRNLLLTDGARADSVPNLEIETGEIEGAGHASATGRFDDEQLFYLQSRGVPADEARRLVVRGFFAELVQQIGVPEVEQRLMAAIEDELTGALGSRAATPQEVLA